MSLVTCTNNPTPVWTAGDGPVLLFNRDIANTIIWGTDSGISGGPAANINEYHILDPLGTVSLLGTDTVYASTLAAGKTAQLDVIPNASDAEAGPAQVAASISALGLATLVEQINQNTAIPQNISTTGAPLLNLYNSLADGAAVTLPAGNSITLGPFPISQIAYEFVISAGTSQNATSVPIEVFLEWTDSVSGLTTAQQDFGFYCAYTGAGGPAHLVEGHGPSNADTLTVTINNSTAIPATVSYALLQSSRNYLRHEWRTQNPASIAVSFAPLTYVSCAPANNILAAQQTGTIANNTSETYLLPLYTAAAMVYLHSAQAAIGATATLQDNITSLNSVSIQKWSAIATGDLAPPGIATLPRDQCTVVVANATGAASNVQFGMIAQELQTS